MKRLFLILIIFWCFTVVSHAQNSSILAAFAPENEEFSVETNFTFQIQEWNKEERFYSKFLDGNYYYIVSQKPDNTQLFGLLVKTAVDNNPTEEKFSVGQFDGTKFSFKDSDGFNEIIFIVRTDNRLYIFHTLTEKDIEPNIEKFLSSIKINDQSFGKFKTVSKPSNYNKETEQNNITTTNNVTGKSNPTNKTGSDSAGNGVGTVQGGNSSSSTTPLMILSKPKALYTDLARIYQIEGNIIVKVIFLANGELGAIRPQNRLPFGLTTSAVAAARRVKFRPQKTNDVPISVFKLLEYSFTLY